MRLPSLFKPALSLVLILLTRSSFAIGPAYASGTVSPAGVSVVASVQVAASPAVLWATLTDYNRLQLFIPDMQLSRVISAPGQPPVVEQRSDAGMFALVVPEHVTLSMVETPPGSIRFRAISGAVASLTGEWLISEQDHITLLNYHVHMMPLLPVLITLPSGIVEREVKLHMEAIAGEAERRMRSVAKR